MTVSPADALKLNTSPYFTADISTPAPILCLSSSVAQTWKFDFPYATDD